jgi:hypothetical protein
MGRVSAINGPGAGSYQGEVVLPAANKIDAFALLEIVGVLEVADGTVISEEGVLAFGGTATEVFGRLAFAGGEFVFEAAGGGLGEGEELGIAGAQVEFVEGINGRILVLVVARVVGSVGDLMTVGRPDFPTLEFGQDGEEVVLGTPVGELVSAPGPGEGWQQGESLRTGEGGEVVTAG